MSDGVGWLVVGLLTALSLVFLLGGMFAECVVAGASAALVLWVVTE